MLAHALGVMGLLRCTQRQQNETPPAHALAKAAIEAASIERSAFSAQALSLLARHLLPAADAREARVLAACICGAALELGPARRAPRAAAGLVDGLSRHVDARQEASEQERQVFACVLAAMQAWDKQRRDLLPRHVLVLVSSFVRAELADALVLRAAANILEARSDWLPTPRARHPFKPLAAAPRTDAGRSSVGVSNGNVGKEGGGGGITAMELSGIATASTKMMLLITAHEAARALQTATAAATAAGPASFAPRSPASASMGGGGAAAPVPSAPQRRPPAVVAQASPALETGRILDYVRKCGMLIDLEHWASSSGGGAASIALTLSALARASYRPDDFLSHLCRALVLQLPPPPPTPHATTPAGVAAAGAAGGPGGRGGEGGRSACGALSTREVAQAMHALAVLNFADAAALDALSRAVSPDADYCLQSLANLGLGFRVLVCCVPPPRPPPLFSSHRSSSSRSPFRLAPLPSPSPLSPLTHLSGASLRHPAVRGAVYVGAVS